MSGADPQRERRAITIIRVAGTVVLLLLVVFLALVPAQAVHENVPGLASPMLGFELATTPAHVFGILGAPGEPARADTVWRFDLANRIDFVFMLAYPWLFFGIALLLEAHGSLSRRSRVVLGVLAVAMALGDALENRELLFLSGAADAAAMQPSLARLHVFTTVKWTAIFAAAGLIGVGVAGERGWWRWSAPLYGLAALGGLVVALVSLRGIEAGMYLLALGWVFAYARALAGATT